MEKVAFDPHESFPHDHHATPHDVEKTGEKELGEVEEDDTKGQMESSDVKEYLDTRAMVSSQGRIVEKVARSFVGGETEDELKRNLVEKGQGTKTTPMLSSIILLIALGSHAIFEGIALGLMQTYMTVLNIMLASAAHKWAAALALVNSRQ